jgi:CheY-like chemotaxis protein
MASKQVLCVDDDGFVLAAIRRLLETNGYNVVTAPNGETALAWRGRSFDVVVLDYNLPGMNGFAVARELRRRRQSIPILMYAGCAEIPRGATDDIAAFVSKGDTVKKLLDTIGELATRAA